MISDFEREPTDQAHRIRHSPEKDHDKHARTLFGNRAFAGEKSGGFQRPWLGGRFMRLDNQGHLANAMLAMRSVTHAAAQLSENFTLEKRPQ